MTWLGSAGQVHSKPSRWRRYPRWHWVVRVCLLIIRWGFVSANRNGDLPRRWDTEVRKMLDLEDFPLFLCLDLSSVAELVVVLFSVAMCVYVRRATLYTCPACCGGPVAVVASRDIVDIHAACGWPFILWLWQLLINEVSFTLVVA